MSALQHTHRSLGSTIIAHHDAPTSGKHICLVDYGNYPFLFDLAANWPAQLGRMSYLFGMSQVARNTAASGVGEVRSGGIVFGLRSEHAAPDHFLARHRAEARAARAAVEQLDRLNPDIVIGANNPLDIQAQIANWCRRRGRPFVFWLQDLRGLAMKSILKKRIPFLGAAVAAHYMSSEKRLLRRSAHVISIAEEFLPHVLSSGLPANRVSVIPNWAPLSRIPLRPKDNAWSRATGLSRQRVLLYSGNLGMKHNPAILLALCESLKSQPDTSVAVVAEGVGAAWLAEKAKERGLGNLCLRPFVTTEELPDVLGTADACIALLESDAAAYSVPSKIWTYFCAGKPLILSIPEDNQAALIVKKVGAGASNSPTDERRFVANCLDMLAKTPDERAAIGARGRAYAESNFNMESIVERVARCLNLALGSEKASPCAS